MQPVSIPERVWGGLEHPIKNGGNTLNVVSIPERVWGGLEQVSGHWYKSKGPFQSLRGFGVGWSKDAFIGTVRGGLFQSLRGFGVGWSARMSIHPLGTRSFQSLRGFGVGWSGC